MRTAPSDKWQALAMVQLLQEFGWNWVAVIGSDETYGKEGQKQVSQNAADGGICVAYEGLIPVYEDPVSTISEILDGIVEAKVGVVVVFASSTASAAFFREVSEEHAVSLRTLIQLISTKHQPEESCDEYHQRYHPEVDHFPLTAQPKVLYNIYYFIVFTRRDAEFGF